MDKLQEFIQVCKNSYDNIYILIGDIAIFILIAIIVLGISNSNSKKISKTIRLSICYLVLFIVYFTILILNPIKLGWKLSFMLTFCKIGMLCILECLLLIIACIFIIIYKLIKYTGIKKKSESVKITKPTETKTYNESNPVVTKLISRFTSEYLKSFIRPGITIDRLEILKDNKQNYITKLKQVLTESNQNYSNSELDTISEVYYNYYIKKFSDKN